MQGTGHTRFKNSPLNRLDVPYKPPLLDPATYNDSISIGKEGDVAGKQPRRENVEYSEADPPRGAKRR